MRRSILASLILLASLGAAYPQATTRPCITQSSGPCLPVSSATPMPVTPSAPSGTQDVNVTQVLGAAPSATNPLWVSPATASTPWVSTGSGTAGTAAAGVLTVQGIGSMTPLLVTLSGSNTVNTVTAVTGITNTVTTQVVGASFTNITTNTDTNVKGTPGTLVGLSINTIGVTSSVQLFNDADGTCSSGLIGTFSTLIQNFVQINAAATIGICAKTAGGGAADITVYYR